MVQDFLEESKTFVTRLQDQLKKIRTGRAHTSLVEDHAVEVTTYGGTWMPLRDIASISVADSNLIVVTPFDPGTFRDIERSLAQNDLGITPSTRDNSIHLNIPPLTQERRQQFVKMVHEKVEETKVALRNLRTDVKKLIEDQKGEAGISEDDIKRQLDDLQKAVDGVMEQVESIGKKKEEELLQI